MWQHNLASTKVAPRRVLDFLKGALVGVLATLIALAPRLRGHRGTPIVPPAPIKARRRAFRDDLAAAESLADLAATDPELAAEFAAWDELSDEAFLGFEEALITDGTR